MANPGFGLGGGTGSGDFEALARQYWDAWGEFMRGASPSPQPAVPGWSENLQWWSRLAKGQGGGRSEANEAVDRFNSQARDWFGQVQRLAAQFAGTDASARDITLAWKQLLGGAQANPFGDMFGAMRGPGQNDLSKWIEQITPFLEGLQREGRTWLGLPAFGFAREHQERLQHLAQVQLDYQQQSNAYNALMAEAGQEAFKRFEDKLADREEPGRQITSARALFDLWIDAAEEAYADIALSPRFRDAYAALVNSQMRVRAAVQKEIEQTSQLLGMPTRTEIDSAHRKIVQLERELRRLRDAVQTDSSGGRGAEAPRAPAAARNASAPASASAAASAEPEASPAPVKAAPVKAAPIKAAPAAKKSQAKKTAIAKPEPPAKPAAARAVRAEKRARSTKEKR